MNSPLVGIVLPVRRWRVARQLFATVALAFGATGAVAQTNAVSTLAGSLNNPGYTNATGTAAQFRFTNPSGAAVDGSGNVYIADALNHAIRKIDSNGVVTTFAGSTTGVSGNVNSATATDARFSSPQGIAIDGAGNLFVADTGNHAIRMITSGGVVSTIAGPTPGNSGSGLVNNATGANARFNTPLGITTDRTGGSNAAVNLFVADSGNNAIRQVVVATGATTTLSGGPTATGADSTLANAQYSLPSGVASNTAGTLLYVADTNNHRIRRLDISGNAVTTLAGSGSAGYTEGTGAGAVFNFPRGIALSSDGNTIYVADTVNHVIRTINTSGTTTLFAGTAGASGSANGLALGTARFNFPSGIANGGTGTFVVDTSNQIVRRIAAATAPSITAQPAASVTVTAGATAQFTVGATGNPPVGFQWEISTNSGGSWSSLNNGSITGGVVSGATTNQLSISSTTSALNNAQFRVIVSNGVSPNATSTVSSLTVNSPPVITNASTNFFVTVGQSISGATITATGSPAPTFAVTGGTFPTGWASLNPNTGAITGTPTDNTGSPFSFQVTATNSGGSSTPVTFTITVQSGPAITTQPGNQTVQAGQTATFSVVASSSPAVSGYQWQFSTNSGATWSDLTVGSFPGGGTVSGATSSTMQILSVPVTMNGYQFRVVVTNSVGSSTSNAATLTVTQIPVFTSATNATFVANQGNTFTVVASGSPSPTFSVIGGNFPSSWATLNSSTGVITGAPTSDHIAASPYVFVIQASNLGGTAQQTFTLDVSATPLAPQITTQPSSQSVGLGQTATFSVVATGSPAPSYQWQRFRTGEADFVSLTDDGTFSGATTATLAVSNVSTLMNGDLFRVVVTNVNGTATSNTAQLTVELGTVFFTLAGQAGASGGVDGTGAGARFFAPTSIALDTSGTAYVADAANHVIRKVTSAGAVTTLAGTAGASGNADGFAAAARFNSPGALAVDSAGNVYVADSGNHTIRKITAAGHVTTLAGSAGSVGTADGIGSNARFGFPSGIAVDSFGVIYVADTLNHTIRKITADNAVITFVAASAGLLFPQGLAIDSSFNLYVADSRNHVIRRVNSAGTVTTVAGTIGAAGSINGNGTAARFNQPLGVDIATDGNLYVADTQNHIIRRVATNGDVTTVAGLAGTTGTADGAGSTARFNQPYDVAIATSGEIWIVDTGNHTIRRSGGAVAAPGIATNPQSVTAAVGTSATFTATATGTPTPAFQWQRQAAGTGGFVNLSNDATYTGVATGTLTVANVTTAMSGDQFRAVASNLVEPAATTAAATLTVIAPPVFTSANSATFRAGEAGTFTVTVNSTPAATFSATGLPAGITINPTNGIISGTPSTDSGSPFTIVITANNTTSTTTAVTQNFTLTVLPANIPAAITTQPVGAAVSQGSTATLSVSATGTGTLQYQWFKDNVAINGATSSSLSIPNVQSSSAGIYTVEVKNAFGTATSNPVVLSVNTAPLFVTQPRSQTVLAGSTVSFTAGVTGAAGTTYQWRKNGIVIPGATSAALTLSGVSTVDAGSYEVTATNSLGSATSSLVQLVVATGAVAPVFTSQPASRTAVAGSSVTLSATAMGVPAPNYQWRKNGIAIGGATNSTLALANVQAGDSANYDVIASNSAGSITSSSGTLRVIARSYAGIYFGSFAGGLGNFALLVREDNTGVVLGYLPSSNSAIVGLSLTIGDNGEFSFVQTPGSGFASVSLSGNISTSGSVSGSINGAANASLSASRMAVTGSTEGLAGFYQAGATTGGAVGYVIANALGQAFAVVHSGAVTDGGQGALTSSGQLAIATGRTAITGNITPGSRTLTISSSGAVTATLSGASEEAAATQRLANISSRARVTGTTSLAIAGFVVSGTESKPVLIRAVGPSLANFGITDRLATPALQLFRGQTVIASNTGVGTSADSAAIAAAATRAGAFALTSTADSALLVTLPPGNYTAQVSGANNTAGVVLVEVYDLSAPAVAQKLLNISTRAFAGTGADVLTAGIVVTGSVPKRVLIRGVGPGLAQFGLTGVLATPTLSLIRGSTTVASNTGWNTSTDAAAITTSSAQVGAFPLTTGDSAMIVTLTPGDYSAQVSGTAGATGTAIVEVYELP